MSYRFLVRKSGRKISLNKKIILKWMLQNRVM